MRELDSTAGTLAVRFVVIGDRAKTDAFCAPYGLAERCLPDSEKRTYHAMGLEQFDLLKIFRTPELTRRREANRAAGFRQNWAATRIADGAQLPGAAAIDRDGALRWIHRGAHPADLPTMREMLEAAHAALDPATRTPPE